ncbi:hypothetical protein M422DRAFT_34494 [Sphaerobolus stellatus SS14]|uniref:Uncharacterized protein n=1 Tax=Sphaerobolus stellatus (strain SS14) TaxID=990650 RepID=A0A0C9VDL5_SPHS4|nr:hypothetical protein M422DRAFT_34494 [Sphaerobolus stellatus SS14]
MLLKIASGNHLHSEYVDENKGMPVYTVITRSLFTKPPAAGSSKERRGSAISTSSISTASSYEELSDKAWTYPLDTLVDGTPIPFEKENPKHTWILNADGEVIAEIGWGGLRPIALSVRNQQPLFGQFCWDTFFPETTNEPNEFRAKTRIDRLEWVVTKSDMELVNSAHKAVMNFYPRARLDSNGKLHTSLLRGESFIEIAEGDSTLSHLQEAQTAELLVTFCLLEIIRRGKFRLSPYVFDATTSFDRYYAIIRDKYIGVASHKIRQILGRGRSSTI